MVVRVVVSVRLFCFVFFCFPNVADLRLCFIVCVVVVVVVVVWFCVLFVLLC